MADATCLQSQNVAAAALASIENDFSYAFDRNLCGGSVKRLKQMKSNSATKNQTPPSIKRINNASKVGINSNKTKPKSNEKVIKKTDQIEIRID